MNVLGHGLKPSAFSYQLPASSFQLSAISAELRARGGRCPEARTKTGYRQPLFAYASSLSSAHLEREKWCLAPVFVRTRLRREPSAEADAASCPIADAKGRQSSRHKRQPSAFSYQLPASSYQRPAISGERRAIAARGTGGRSQKPGTDSHFSLARVHCLQRARSAKSGGLAPVFVSARWLARAGGRSFDLAGRVRVTTRRACSGYARLCCRTRRPSVRRAWSIRADQG